MKCAKEKSPRPWNLKQTFHYSLVYSPMLFLYSFNHCLHNIYLQDPLISMSPPQLHIYELHEDRSYI